MIWHETEGVYFYKKFSRLLYWSFYSYLSFIYPAMEMEKITITQLNVVKYKKIMDKSKKVFIIQKNLSLIYPPV